MKKLFSLLIIGQLLFSLLFLTTIIPNEASAPQVMPTVSISLTQQSQTAHVGPGDTGQVDFEGVVSVTKNRLTRVVVSLTAEDTWGTAVVSPSSLMFTTNGEQTFTVSVRAPMGESCTTCGSVTVYARWTMYPGNLNGPANPSQGVTGRIDIAQYHKYSFYSPKTYAQTSPGGRVEFELSIANEGNGDDVVNMGVGNEADLTSNGLQVSFSTSMLSIPQYDSDYVYIYVNTFSTTTGGTHEIKVEIAPEDNTDAWYYSYNVELPYNPNSPSPPEEEPEPELEPEPEEEPENEEDNTDYIDDYVQDVEQTGNEDDFITPQEFFILIIILFLMAAGIILLIGWLGNRKWSRMSRRTRRTRRKR